MLVHLRDGSVQTVGRAATLTDVADQTFHLTQSQYTEHPSNMLVHLRDGSAQTVGCAATLIDVADQTFHLTQSQYTDTGPTSPSTDPITPGA